MNRKYVLLVWCLGTILIFGGMPTMQTYAYSVNVSYFIDGIDLDLGVVEPDPTILVVLMGEKIERMIEPGLNYLDDFRPPIEISLGYNPSTDEQLRLLLHNQTSVAAVENGTDFASLSTGILDTLDFAASPLALPFGPDALLIVRSGEDDYFKLRVFGQTDRSIWIEYAKLSDGGSVPVPESSTVLLVALGCVAAGIIRCKQGGKTLLLFLLVSGLFNGHLALAQEDPVTVTKSGSSGDGTIVYGDYRCEPGCQEFTIPYAQYTGNVLKAIPDERSRFTYWTTLDKKLLEREWQVEPGDTIVAVFQDKRELFAEDLRFSEPPDVSISHPTAMRARYVQLFPDVLRTEEQIVLNLFDDVSFVAVTEKLEEDEVCYIWTGSIQEGDSMSQIVIVWRKKGKSISGSVWVDFKLYGIEVEGDGIVTLELDPNPPFVPGEPYVPQQHSSVLKKQNTLSKLAKGLFKKFLTLWTPAVAYAQSSHSVIDVLVLYTMQAKNGAGGREPIEDQIYKAVYRTNDAYTKSGIYQELHIVHTHEVNYVEVDSLDKKLANDAYWLEEQLTNPESEVRQLREMYEADLVCLWVAYPEWRQLPNGAWGMNPGVSNQLKNLDDSTFAKLALSVVTRASAVDHTLYGFTHELGHNMGAGHAWGESGKQPLYPYSHGYVNHSARWRTIMAYGTECLVQGYACPLIPRFSNPDLSFQGMPLGVPETELQPANNAKTLNMSAETVAAFRPLSDFSWKIDMPGGSISSCAPTAGGAIRCVYLVDAPDYETRTSPESFLTISYAGNSGSSPVQVDAHQVSGTGGLPAQEEEPVVFMIDWVIYSRYHGHWKNLKYYLEYTAGSSPPIVSYNATLWPAGPIDNDFTGNEGHGIQFHHPPHVTGDTLAVDLLMSGSVPDLPVQTLATVTVQLPRTFLASGNVYQPVVTAAASARPAVLLPTFTNHSTVPPSLDE